MCVCVLSVSVRVSSGFSGYLSPRVILVYMAPWPLGVCVCVVPCSVTSVPSQTHSSVVNRHRISHGIIFKAGTEHEQDQCRVSRRHSFIEGFFLLLFLMIFRTIE